MDDQRLKIHMFRTAALIEYFIQLGAQYGVDYSKTVKQFMDGAVLSSERVKGMKGYLPDVDGLLVQWVPSLGDQQSPHPSAVYAPFGVVDCSGCMMRGDKMEKIAHLAPIIQAKLQTQPFSGAAGREDITAVGMDIEGKTLTTSFSITREGLVTLKEAGRIHRLINEIDYDRVSQVAAAALP